jgi:serine/threonine protein phosphatase 1
MTIYAIGDIHGQLEMLQEALDLIAIDGGSDAEIVFLGDLVDRGPDSRGVIEHLMQGQAAGRRWHVLKGNHDRMFEQFVRSGVQVDPAIKSGLGWLNLRLGGAGTLASYGVMDVSDPARDADLEAARAAVPLAHLDFIRDLPLWHQHGGLLFVHAGVRPGVALADQTEDDLIWIRDSFLTYVKPHPWLVVHGHTALETPQHFGNRIDLDGGAGYGRQIFGAVFEGRDCWLLTGKGRVALLP